MPIRWTVDTLGWEGTARKISAPVVAARVLAAARPGDALLQVISGLRARGYSFVTLGALTG